MLRCALITTLFVVGVAPIAATAADDHVLTAPDQLKWSAAPPAMPVGAEVALIAGDPSQEGMYVVRLKLPAGYKVPPHVHPNDENITVISGVVNFGMGATFDEQKAHPLKVGSFVKAPKGTQHFVSFPEETILQLHGVGPQGIIYVNPADDPRKGN